MFKQSFKEAALILLIAVVLAAGAYVLRPLALPLMRGDAATSPSNEDDALFKPITIEKAEALFNQGQALFADARSRTTFEQGHISGALHLDPDAMEQWSNDLMARYPPEQIIITYCDGAECDLSKNLAEKLTWLGFEKVYYLTDGWTKWQKRGLAVE